jgi:CPA2 family monovalent cation:H+ antiporter-2
VDWQALGLAGLKAVVMLTTIFGLGRFVLRPLLRVVAQARSAELFAASALLSSLGMAWLAGFAGLSMALGAFLGGVLLAESEYRHQIEADVRPYRAVLLSLFFTTVGMSIDLRFMAASAPEIILAVIGLVIVKAILIAVLCRLFGIGVDQGVRVGLVLAQGSELALVLTALALANGVIADRIAEGLLLVVAVSMALTPALAAAGHRLGMWLERYRGRRASILAATAEAFNDHVVIAGFGRVGQTVARVLAAQEVPFVALDLDLRRVAQGRARGLPVFYGDAGRSDVLAAAGVGDARTAVITLDDPATAERVVQMLRLRFPELQIIVRARDLSQRQSLEKAGATAVVPEALEASLQLSGTVLRSIGIDDEAVDEVIDEFRVDNYARLTEIVPGRETLKRTVKRAAG